MCVGVCVMRRYDCNSNAVLAEDYPKHSCLGTCKTWCDGYITVTIAVGSPRVSNMFSICHIKFTYCIISYLGKTYVRVK